MTLYLFLVMDARMKLQEAHSAILKVINQQRLDPLTEAWLTQSLGSISSTLDDEMKAAMATDLPIEEVEDDD